MAKFFKYKSLDEIREDVRRLGLSIEFSDELERIFEPVSLFGRRAGNAMTVQPMEGCDGTLDGRPDELTFRRYQRFSRGGAKVIWGEATAVTEDGRANPRQLWINDNTWEDFARLADLMRREHKNRFRHVDDFIIGLQLTHSGRWSHRRPVIAVHNPLIDPFTFIDKKKRVSIPEDYPVISDDELQRLEDAFVHAARLAQKAGFDFIDLKQCHSYLLNELLGARTRDGAYGGPFENRTRFIRNVVSRIREEAPGLALASRINIYDGIPWVCDARTRTGSPVTLEKPPTDGFGIDPSNAFEIDYTEPIRLIRMLKDLGVDFFNLSMGSPYYNAHIGRPYEKPAPDMYEAPEHPLIGVDRHFRATSTIKAALPDAVVVGTGYSWLRFFFPHAAEANIRNNRVNFAGLGRGALAYPDFAADLMEKGELNRKKVCLAVSFCTALMRRKDNELGQFPAGCVPRDPVYTKIWHGNE